MKFVLFFALALPLCIGALKNYYNSAYPYYKKVEEAMTKDPRNLYLLRQGFLPVVTAQPWLIDNVHTLMIKIDIQYCNYGSDNTTSANFSRNWDFLWTDSSLLSMISADELLAFDPVIYSVIYSAIVGSENTKSFGSFIQINDAEPGIIDLEKIEDKLLKAVTLFFSWGKAYARSNGVPSVWDERDRGYIGEQYSYYAIGSPFTIQDNYSKGFKYTHLLLLLIFIFINLLLPVTLLKHALKWSRKEKQRMCQSLNLYEVPIVFWVTGSTVTLFNFLYILGLIILHFSGLPNVLNCFLHTRHECTISKSEYEDTLTMEALISKAIVFPVAIAFQLIIATLVARNLEVPAPPLFASRKCHCWRLTHCFKVFIIWQILIFVQIVIGLIGIPLTIVLVISPTKTTFHIVSLITILLFMGFFMKLLFNMNCKKCSCNFKSILDQCISLLEAVLAMIFLAAALLLYNLLTGDGLSMNGVKGYILSLLPTILLSLFVWALKRKFMKEHPQRKAPENLQRFSEIEPFLG